MSTVLYFFHDILIPHFHALGSFLIFHSTQLIETRRNKLWKKKMPEGLKKNQERIRGCTMLKLLLIERTTPRKKPKYIWSSGQVMMMIRIHGSQKNLLSARESNINQGAMSFDYCC